MKLIRIFFLNAFHSYIILIFVNFERKIYYYGEIVDARGLITAWYIKSFSSSLESTIDFTSMLLNFVFINIIIFPIVFFIEKKLSKKTLYLFYILTVIAFIITLIMSYFILFDNFILSSFI